MLLFSAFAALSAFVTWWVHTFLGDRYVLRPFLDAQLRSFPKATLEACWHVVTVVLALVVAALALAALPATEAAVRTTLLIASLLLAVSSTLLFLWVSKRRYHSFRTMPQSYLLGSIALFSSLALAFPVEMGFKAFLALVLAPLLLVLAGIHVYWAFGGVWPAKSRGDLTELVVGQKAEQAFPGRAMTLVVAVLLTGAALWAGAAVSPFAQGLPLYQGVWLLAAVFLLRGFGGFFEFRLRPWTQTLPYGYWNRVLYSPIALLLGLLALGIAWGSLGVSG